MANHHIRVTMLCDGDEYLSLQSMSDDDGLSDSAFMRLLLKQEARRRALALVSDRNRSGDSTEPTQVVRSKFHGVQQ
jgi:hypothetical protein